jgi:hypothetical protein
LFCVVEAGGAGTVAGCGVTEHWAAAARQLKANARIEKQIPRQRALNRGIDIISITMEPPPLA